MKAWNSTLNASRTSLRRSEMKKGTKRMNKIGRRGLNWLRVRRNLKAEFERKGITACEFRISEHCTPLNFLSFAHSVKRRFIETEEQLRECGLACFACHQILDERMSHAEMFATVRETIAKRAA